MQHLLSTFYVPPSFRVLGIGPRASCLLGSCEPHLSPLVYILYLKQALLGWPQTCKSPASAS
jgi:hypothetical protein